MVSQQSQEQTLLEENVASGNGTGEMEIEDIDIDSLIMKTEALSKETEKLRQMNMENNLNQSNYAPQALSNAAALKQKLEADSRSVYLNQVEYSSTAEQIRDHFAGCGEINRITILKNNQGFPKGCAYIEFESSDSVVLAMALNNSPLNGRALQVTPKRTNKPGMKAHYGHPGAFKARYNPHFGGRGRGRGRGRGGFHHGRY